jgi:hypothetical protein
LSLDDNTANVVEICKLLYSHFKKNMVLVDSKCLKLVDSIHTRGSSFWKSTRKVYCLEEESFKRLAEAKKRCNDDIFDSDEDDELTEAVLSKNKKPAHNCDVKLSVIEKKIDKMQNLFELFLNEKAAFIKMQSLKSFLNCIICLEIPGNN